MLRSSSRSGLAQRQVERGERLVQQEQRRIGGERAAEGDALVLAARELARVALREGLEAEPRQHLVHPATPLVPARGRAGRSPRCPRTVRCGNSA